MVKARVTVLKVQVVPKAQIVTLNGQSSVVLFWCNTQFSQTLIGNKHKFPFGKEQARLLARPV